MIDEHREIYYDTPFDDHVNRMCLADSRMFLPGLNLAYTDRASMAASTEVRVPFVDPVVARAAFSLKGSDKIRGRRQKVALKEAAQAWLPDEIVNRPKASFSAPLRAWVAHELRPVVDEVLLNGELVSTGFLRRRRARAARRRGALGPRGPVEADLAAAHSGAVAPQRDEPRRRELGATAEMSARARTAQSKNERGRTR